MTDYDQRRPRRSAAVIPSPASEDTADRSDDHRRPADVVADDYSAVKLAEHLAHAKFSAPKIYGAVNFTLRADPEAAAEDLRVAVGGRAAAYRWAVALVAEVGR